MTASGSSVGGGLVAGALVRWPGGPGAPLGVILEVDGPRIKVRFDEDPQPRIFNAKAGVIQRVELAGMVQRMSTGAIGLLHSMTTTTPPRWQAIFDARLITVSEHDLRPHILDDPHSRMVEGRLGGPRQFSLALTARRYELENLTNELVALGQSRVDIKPHQVSVVHKVVTNYPHRFLLCDEVGLGKTIEAGMILKELRARGGAARVLVIAPANLTRQWQFELKSKFNETFSIINRQTVKYLQSTQVGDANPFESSDSVIVSASWITGKDWAKAVTEVDWDLVIVDEAHHARARVSGARRSETGLYKLVRQLVSPDAFSKRAALLLTATPMQLDSGELYSLVELLDPALFPTVQHFDRHLAEVPGLSRLVHDLQTDGFPLPGRDPDDVAQQVAEWLGSDAADVLAALSSGTSGIDSTCAALSSKHLLSEVLVRNRKKIIGGFMPRHATRWEVHLSAPERAALEAVEEYVREGYAQADRTNDAAYGFVMVLFQKLMASSIRALRMSLDRRRQRLEVLALDPVLTKKMRASIEQFEGQLDDDSYLTAILDEVGAANAAEASELAQIVNLLDAVPTDSKADALVEQLAAIRDVDPSAKVLLFTGFRETQEYLRTRIEDIGWDVNLFHGQMSPSAKDASVEAFRGATGPSVLLSTEAGGEGRNFQFCHLLVNYDLPWNPMRVEQRIGRVDRIGQDHTVQVFNFWVRGTIEERVLDVLERRINVFEQTVGGLDPILGEAEKDLKRILKLGGEKRDEALRKFEEQVERKLANARAAEEKLRDFIMETKSYSTEIASMLVDRVSPITAADQERFILRLLKDVSTSVERHQDGTCTVMFREPFVSDYPEHVKGESRRRTVALRRDVKPDSELVEFLALGHPIVDDLIARSTDPGYAGAATAFQVDGLADVAPTSGWLIVYELGVPALREVRELVPYFVHQDGRVDRNLGQVLLERAASFPKDIPVAADQVPSDALAGALEATESVAHGWLAEMESSASAESRRQYEHEKAKLDAYFDYRDQAAQDRLASSQAVLASVEAATDVETRRIVPVWRANVDRDQRLIAELAEDRVRQLNQLELRVSGSGDSQLVGVAWVEIGELA